MGKKAKRIKVRKAWKINPKTKLKKSKKLYSRKTKKRLLRSARNDDGVLEGY
jgi:hypothetical protein